MSRKHRDGDERFAALAQLKGEARRYDDRPAAPPVAPTARSEDEGDRALFRASLSGVSPMRPDNHAEIARPKPTALPRPRPVEEEPEAPPAKPLNLLDAAYRDVTRLKESGRVELDGQRRGLPGHISDWAPPAIVRPPLSKFEQAILGAVPLADTGRLHLAPEPPPAIPRQKERNDKEVLRESLEAPFTFEDRLDMGEEAAFLRPGLPRRVLSDLRRGRWVVQKELDLHGLTRDEARQALAQFLAACLRDGQRCLRLIHGKGLGSPGGEPVLKHLSRGWLSQREDILAFCQARPHDGGAGALLILLRAGQPG